MAICFWYLTSIPYEIKTKAEIPEVPYPCCESENTGQTAFPLCETTLLMTFCCDLFLSYVLFLLYSFKMTASILRASTVTYIQMTHN